ncbi:Heat shock-related 70 kDa protein 2 [Orchesella cincta]|uniref:Heat shock-related 70 kDa protein 2 n=1 Tax=Orchesella cincta TaxID=48709 RepID=A0A1D2MKE7_ORCCI|nr:Heat shock-related 70 kDa protein 2 [Orchesella cincta]
MNPKNTSLMQNVSSGGSLMTLKIQQDIKTTHHWPFTVINDNGKPKLEVDFKGRNQAIHPRGTYFNNSQRQATKDAGAIAGLKCFENHQRANSSCSCYGLDKKGEKECAHFRSRVVAPIKMESFEVKSTAGDTHLVVKILITEWLTTLSKSSRESTRRTSHPNKRASRRLRTACEGKAKITLSALGQASIEIDSLFDGIDLYSSITPCPF